MIKRWFNRRFPYYRLCNRRWCLRIQTYDYRCTRHQGDNRASGGISAGCAECARRHPDRYARWVVDLGQELDELRAQLAGRRQDAAPGQETS